MIEVQNLSRYYGEFAAISDLSFSIKKNEIIGFLGLNGAGKSTTLKLLSGLLEPSEGSITFQGQPFSATQTKLRSKIGFLPEEPPLYKDMTVREFLLYVGELRGLSKTNVKERLEIIIPICQLEDRVDQLIEELSLGFRKRVGIAQAIIHKPELVILDEPISGLDPFQIVEMRTVIRNLSKEATILLSSHNLTEVAETCDRLLILHQGKIIAEGSTAELSGQINSQQQTSIIECELTEEKEALLQTLFGTMYRKLISPNLIDKIEITHINPTPEIVMILVENDISIHSVQRQKSGLENIFLSLTQGDNE